MLTSIKRWLSQLPLTDPEQIQQARLVQVLLLAILALSSLGSFIALLAPIPRTDALVVIAGVWVGVPVSLAGLALLRRDRLRYAVLLTCAGLVGLLSFLLVTTGAGQGGALLFGYALPIVLAGLVADRRVLWLTVGMCAAGIVLAMALERLGASVVGIAAPRGDNTAGILGGFAVIAVILGIFVARFGEALRQALRASRDREQRLTELAATLEDSVAARTAELSEALAAARVQSEAQAQLLRENAEQRAVIQRIGVPVLPVSADTLVMPLVGALDGARLQEMHRRALEALEHSRARRLVLDISGVPLVDRVVAQGIVDVVAEVRLLGATAALVGVRPEVAQEIVALGAGLAEVRTYRDLEAALRDGR